MADPEGDEADEPVGGGGHPGGGQGAIARDEQDVHADIECRRQHGDQRDDAGLLVKIKGRHGKLVQADKEIPEQDGRHVAGGGIEFLRQQQADALKVEQDAEQADSPDGGDVERQLADELPVDIPALVHGLEIMRHPGQVDGVDDHIQYQPDLVTEVVDPDGAERDEFFEDEAVSGIQRPTGELMRDKRRAVFDAVADAAPIHMNGGVAPQHYERVGGADQGIGQQRGEHLAVGAHLQHHDEDEGKDDIQGKDGQLQGNIDVGFLADLVKRHGDGVYSFKEDDQQHELGKWAEADVAFGDEGPEAPAEGDHQECKRKRKNKLEETDGEDGRPQFVAVLLELVIHVSDISLQAKPQEGQDNADVGG